MSALRLGSHGDVAISVGGASGQGYSSLVRRIPRRRSCQRVVLACDGLDLAGSEDHRRILIRSEDKNSERRGRWSTGFEVSRRWVDAGNPVSEGARDFAIISHNILGDHYSSKHRDLYVDIPIEYMKWDRRKELILHDICRWNADIVCLQEVDRYHDLQDFMSKQGYAGTFKRRTGGTTDGCAIFWREEELYLLEDESIEFKSFHLWDNIAQLCIFETRKGETRRFLVGNTHVLFNPNRGEIKIGQIRVLLQNAHALAEKRGGIPVVVAGDFNCTPQSALYKFLLTSELNLTAHEKKFVSGQKKRSALPSTWPNCGDHSWTNEELRMATGQWGCTQVGHPLKLQSAYASVKGGKSTRGPEGEPLATSYHSKFLGTVDYIWYSVGLSPTRVLDTPSLNNLRKINGLPWENIGSDHLALACDFVFTRDPSERGR
ncbi:carbon catabolite repressor protein 4 homolog 3-like isoform X2 [Wolffia australiana]